MAAATERASAVPPVDWRLRRGAAEIAASLGRVLATLLLEAKLNATSAAPWVVGGILAALGYITVRTSPEATPYSMGWALSWQAGPLITLMLTLLAASFANRAQRFEAAELEQSKRVASEELVLGRWAGMLVSLAVPLGLLYAVTIAAQLYHGKSGWHPVPYALSLIRLAPAILCGTTLAFTLVALTRVLVLGAGLAGLAWFVLYFGTQYYPTVLRVDLSQNGRVFVGLWAALLLALVRFYGASRRARRTAVPRVLNLLLALTLAATGVHAFWAALFYPSRAGNVAAWQRLPHAESRPRPEREGESQPPAGTAAIPGMAAPQAADPQRKDQPLPNFAWYDADGRRVSLALLQGNPVLLVLVQPKDTDLLPLLRRVERIEKELAGKLRTVVVFLGEDLAAAREAARESGVRIPVVTDWGIPATGNYDTREGPSVLSAVLRISTTPAAVLLDSEGREMTRELPLDPGSGPSLVEQLKSLVAEAAEGGSQGEAP